MLEVKNVPIKESFSSRDAINQAVTYAVTYRTDQVLLVHPRASQYQDAGLRLLGQIDAISVYQYRFDLGAADLTAEDEFFGAAVGRLLGRSP